MSETAEARAWAERAIEEYVLAPNTRELLTELYRPGVETLIGAFEEALHADTDAVNPSSYYQPASSLKGLEVDGLLDRLDEPGLRTVLLWTLVSHWHDSRPWRWKQNGLRFLLLHHSARRGIDWTTAELSLMLRAVTLDEEPFPERLYALPIAACERADDATLAACLAELRAAERNMGGGYPLYGEGRRAKARMRALLSRADPTVAGTLGIFGSGNPFGELVGQNLPEALETPGLAGLLRHCATLAGTRPTAAWRRGLPPLLEAVPDAAGTIRALLEQVQLVDDDAFHSPEQDWEGAILVLRGLTWCVDALPPEDTRWAGRVLGDLARHTGTGPGGSKALRAERLASAAIAVLASRGDETAVAALARVRAKVKKKTMVNAVERGLDRVAKQLGLTREELVERTVPDFGLGAGGRREEELSGHPVALEIGGDGVPALTFRSAAGKPVKSVPKAVREAHPERLKELRAEVKELRAALAAERFRLEAALGDGRTWEVGTWRRYYLEHPLTGHFARRLLWEVSTDAGATWRAGLPERDGEKGWRLAGVEGEEVFHTTGESAAPPVLRMWHPIRWRPEEVHAWRERLMDGEVVQPVKQAFREVYLLTPAEEETRVYSNRYAAHILKYHQAKALLAGRGWSGPQLGYWDGGFDGYAERTYRDAATATEWTARFFVQIAESDGDHVHVSYCATDQVRFSRESRTESVPLREVPDLVLSEAMRDVDLAVGVTSIAADPEWNDTGEDRHHAYWRRVGFGALTESGEMRRAALERIVPRLRIAERLELTDRFLRVRGDIRTYRIHLGSANILMEPDDSYLCVVPQPAKGGQVYLPFESDGGRLSVILSKAFLLAGDTAITDPTITRQLRRGM